MQHRRWSFVLPFLLFNLFCAGALLVLLGFFEVPFGKRHLFALLYFLLLGGGLHAWQESALATDAKVSVQRFMTGMVIKMLLTLFLLLIAIVKMPKSSVISFVLPFIGLYLAHLAYTTVRLSALLRRPKP